MDFDFIDISELSQITDVNASEWRRLHFRSYRQPSQSPSKSASKKAEDFQSRLRSYDSPAPLPHPALQNSSVIRICDNWFCDENTFDATICPYLSVLLGYSK